MAQAFVATQRCTQCGIEKPETGFYAEPRNANGLRSNCKECFIATKKRYYEANRAKWAEYQRAYRRSERGRQAQQRSRRVERATKRLPARSAVARAVREKRMPPARTLTCQHCGKPAAEYHHHKGYEPEHHLDVIPLCHPCHDAAG